jgi:hypothetical protein
MRKIEFIKDFATKKKGELWECDGLLAASLIHRKVAKYFKPRAKKKNESN